MGRARCEGSRRTVPAAPSMVPTQLKMLSPSGNALMPASALVCGWKRKESGERSWVRDGRGRGEGQKPERNALNLVGRLRPVPA